MKKLLSPLIFIFVVVGCKNETPAPEFEVLTIDEISVRECNPEEENCAFISIQVPWLENSNSRDKQINREIENHVINLMDYEEENSARDLESMSKNFISNYEASSIEFPEYNIPWEANVEGRVLINSPEVISIQFDLALFTGGAHGYTSKSFLNIDPETGEVYKTEDLFTSEFKGYAEDLFRKKHDIPENESINSTGYFFENDSFHLPKNIGFVKNKIILRYNAYEVASYSEGGIQLEIPREEARDFMKFL
ncbi:MAG TPA: DUF4163 domain-containing protein [Gillisia sp.]|nr:DUF4163 domain-containing protein [Gillisia sp.]